MMTPKQAVGMYLKGAIVSEEVVMVSLNAIDPKAPEIVLRELPVEFLVRIAETAVDYRRATAWVNYGELPSDEQVAAAAKWIEKSLVHERA